MLQVSILYRNTSLAAQRSQPSQALKIQIILFWPFKIFCQFYKLGDFIHHISFLFCQIYHQWLIFFALTHCQLTKNRNAIGMRVFLVELAYAQIERLPKVSGNLANSSATMFI